MWMRLLACAAAALPAFAADWNPRAAASYLDGRQKQWFEWPAANASAKPCVSCHTGMTYLLARPALRRVLGEAQPTPYEKGLLESLRARVAIRAPKELFPKAAEPHLSEAAGVEAIFAAWFLRSPEAYSRMWAFQREDGSWAWNSYELDPWETPESAYFGAALAAIAAGDNATPRLLDYLRRESPSQPLHNRLIAAWAGIGRKAALEELWSKQSGDGGFSLAALGPWRKTPAAGTDAYATAFAAAIARKAGLPADPRLARALAWLRSQQDPQGYWDAASMNKKHEPGSIPAGFMRDAATAFAVVALCE